MLSFEGCTPELDGKTMKENVNGDVARTRYPTRTMTMASVDTDIGTSSSLEEELSAPVQQKSGVADAAFWDEALFKQLEQCRTASKITPSSVRRDASINEVLGTDDLIGDSSPLAEGAFDFDETLDMDTFACMFPGGDFIASRPGPDEEDEEDVHYGAAVLAEVAEEVVGSGTRVKEDKFQLVIAPRVPDGPRPSAPQFRRGVTNSAVTCPAVPCPPVPCPPAGPPPLARGRKSGGQSSSHTAALTGQDAGAPVAAGAAASAAAGADATIFQGVEAHCSNVSLSTALPCCGSASLAAGNIASFLRKRTRSVSRSPA
mmetsp:Transcript_77757/g.175799  ORF Transcript_77757/g.175799 Transcript_77757/m.175799 type:complete len:316 (+) Transcript_77757:59-1006(+)